MATELQALNYEFYKYLIAIPPTAESERFYCSMYGTHDKVQIACRLAESYLECKRSRESLSIEERERIDAIWAKYAKPTTTS